MNFEYSIYESQAQRKRSRCLKRLRDECATCDSIVLNVKAEIWSYIPKFELKKIIQTSYNLHISTILVNF